MQPIRNFDYWSVSYGTVIYFLVLSGLYWPRNRHLQIFWVDSILIFFCLCAVNISRQIDLKINSGHLYDRNTFFRLRVRSSEDHPHEYCSWYTRLKLRCNSSGVHLLTLFLRHRPNAGEGESFDIHIPLMKKHVTKATISYQCSINNVTLSKLIEKLMRIFN